MVRFILSSEIRERVREYNELKVRENLFIDAEAPSIEHLQLVEIAIALQTAAKPTMKSRYSLANMLKYTTLYIEPKPIPKPNPEYQARITSLRRRLEEQEYNAMVSSVKPSPKISLFSDEDFTSMDAKMTKNQLSAIINILLSMVSVFVAIFVWMKNSPEYLRVLWSLFFAAVVGISETGLYMLHWWNLEQHRSPKSIRTREKRNEAKNITRNKKLQ